MAKRMKVCKRHRARDRRLADHRREGAGRAADDDVLRRPALQPDRVDDDVEEDREGEEGGGEPVGDKPERQHRADGKRHAEGQRLLGPDAPVRDRPLACARHQRVDIGVPPHVEAAGSPGSDRDHDERGEGDDGACRRVRDGHADERREHDERHHPRLQERDVVGDLAAGHGRGGRRGFRRVRCGSSWSPRSSQGRVPGCWHGRPETARCLESLSLPESVGWIGRADVGRREPDQ